jgi:two-component system nitrogen regulation response regulator GlnG
MIQPKLDVPYSVWLIDDDQSIRWVLERALSNAGFVITLFETASSALSQYKRIPSNERPQVILTDIRMPGISGFELLKQVKNVDSTQTVIIMTAYSDLDTTVQGYQQGAFEYLPKPFDIDDAIALVTRACKSQDRNRNSTVHNSQQIEFIGDSQPIHHLFRQLGKLASFSNHVLISGEQGTGKTLVAKAIHHNGADRNAPFIRVDLNHTTTMQAIVDITSALEQQPIASVLLRHVDTLAPAAQRELAQYLADYANDEQNSLRIISTTTSNLLSLVQNKSFDETLYRLLNEISLILPPLRERRGDIPLLIRHFLKKFADDLTEDAKQITSDAMAFLEQYKWNGNVSQLENFCRSMSISNLATINLEALPAELFQQQHAEVSFAGDHELNEWEYQLGIWAMRELAAGHTNILTDANSKLEKTLLECALHATSGRKHEAAKLLGWGRNTLTRKLKAWN